MVIALHLSVQVVQRSMGCVGFRCDLCNETDAEDGRDVALVAKTAHNVGIFIYEKYEILLLIELFYRAVAERIWRSSHRSYS